ncbi:MAG: preprotein translocase subunit SecG [candidate division WOR-3 bacterium]|nr:preprotein translocase subunit SecG [candidate division WOR-3 bacterium]
MYGVIFALHVLICILLIVVVLIQQTRGAGMSSVFGGGGSDSLFGGKGATPFFIKLTSGLAVAFFLTSLFLVILSRRPVPKTAVEKGIETEIPTAPVSPTPEEQIPSVPQDQGGE